MPTVDDILNSVAAPQPAGVTTDDVLGGPSQAELAARGTDPDTYATGAAVQQTGPMRYVRQLAGDVGTVAGSLYALPGDINNLISRGAQAVLPGNGGKMLFPPVKGGNSLTDWLTQHGVIDNPAVTPQGSGERYGNAAVKGVLSAAPFAMTGGVPALVSGLAGGLSGEAAHEQMPNSKIAPAIAGLIGGGLAGGLTSGGLALAAKMTPESIAAGLSPARTFDQAGGIAQGEAEQWLKQTMPAKLAAVSDPLDAAVPGDTPTSLHNYHSKLQEILHSDPDAAPTLAVLSSNKPAQLLAALQRTPAGAETADILDSAPGEAPPTETIGVDSPTTWSAVRAMRSRLGDALANRKSPLYDMDENQKRALYGAISEDLKDTASKNGAGDLFSNFNQESTRLYDLAGGPIGKLASAENPASAVTRLLGQGSKTGQDLSALRAEIPAAADAIAAAHISQPDYLPDWRQTGAKSVLSPEAREALIPDEAARGWLAKAGEAAAKARPGSTNDLLNLARHLGPAAIGLALGHETGPGLVGELGGFVLGAAAPYAGRGLKTLARSPNTLLLPGVGGLAGGNAP